LPLVWSQNWNHSIEHPCPSQRLHHNKTYMDTSRLGVSQFDTRTRIGILKVTRRTGHAHYSSPRLLGNEVGQLCSSLFSAQPHRLEQQPTSGSIRHVQQPMITVDNTVGGLELCQQFGMSKRTYKVLLAYPCRIIAVVTIPLAGLEQRIPSILWKRARGE
jgi:hypothetical protein